MGSLGVALLSAFVPGCCCSAPVELCVRTGGLRCAGNSLVSCPGGWGTLSLTPSREVCAEGLRCGAFVRDYGAIEPMCLPSFGACDGMSFTPFCFQPDASTTPGGAVYCVDGGAIVTATCIRLPDGGWLEGAVGGPREAPFAKER
jgi:hypothetical protein